MKQDEQGVKKAIQYYFDGTAHGDIDALKKGYTTDCKIYFVNDAGDLDSYDQDQFHQIIRENHAKKLKRINQLLSLEIYEHMATAKVRSDYPAFYFVDFLTLLRNKGEWKIVAKATVRSSK